MGRELDNHLIEAPLCGISYRQGYLTGRYYAHDFLGRTLRLSAPFRTWTWRHGNVARHEDEAARAALRALIGELHALGWRVLEREAEAITEETVFRALSRISGDDGATAAEVGRAVLGYEAGLVQHLPLRVGAELRLLKLHGKVERRQTSGSPKWFPIGAHGATPTTHAAVGRRGESKVGRAHPGRA
jgi:hypothetical protein